MLKGVKIIETIEDFLLEHPEIKVERNIEGKIIKFSFPKEVIYYSYAIVYNDITICYDYHGKSFYFST